MIYKKTSRTFLAAVIFSASSSAISFDFYGIKSGMTEDEVLDFISNTGYVSMSDLSASERNDVVDENIAIDRSDSYAYLNEEKGFHNLSFPPDAMRLRYNHEGKLYMASMRYSSSRLSDVLGICCSDFYMPGSSDGGDTGLVFSTAMDKIFEEYSLSIESSGLRNVYTLSFIDDDLNKEGLYHNVGKIHSLFVE